MMSEKIAQKRIAKIAIGVSAYRNNGKPGLIDLTRKYVENINLDKFAQSLKQNEYDQFLNYHTLKLQKFVKAKTLGKGWGISRKGLNIFFETFATIIILEKNLT